MTQPIKVNREPRVLLDDFYKFLRPIKVGMVVCFILGTVMAACGEIYAKKYLEEKTTLAYSFGILLVFIKEIGIGAIVAAIIGFGYEKMTEARETYLKSLHEEDHHQLLQEAVTHLNNARADHPNLVMLNESASALTELRELKDQLHVFLPFMQSARVFQTNAPEVIRVALSQLYGDQANMAGLASVVLADRPLYRDVDLHIDIADDEVDKDYILATYRLRFTASLDELVLAVVESAILLDQVFASAPRVTDVYISRKADEKKQIEDHPFKYLAPVGGNKKWLNAEVSPVPLNQYSDYLGAIEEKEYANIRLFRSAIPKGCESIQSEFTIRKHRDAHMTFWVSDRPLLLKELRVETRKLTPTPGRKCEFYPFLENHVRLSEEHNSLDVYQATVNNWIVRGQGICITW